MIELIRNDTVTFGRSAASGAFHAADALIELIRSDYATYSPATLRAKG